MEDNDVVVAAELCLECYSQRGGPGHVTEIDLPILRAPFTATTSGASTGPPLQQMTRFIVRQRDDALLVAFRGTASIADVAMLAELPIRWAANALRRVFSSNGESRPASTDVELEIAGSPAGRTFSGFANHYRGLAERLRQSIQTTLRDSLGIRRVVFAGHSLGGVSATLAALEFLRGPSQLPASVVTFGAPPVGDPGFCRAFRAASGRLMQHARVWAARGDVVPRLRACEGAAHLPGPGVEDPRGRFRELMVGDVEGPAGEEGPREGVSAGAQLLEWFQKTALAEHSMLRFLDEVRRIEGAGRRP